MLNGRMSVLEIKDVIWDNTEYRQTLLSEHFYEVVLEEDIRGGDKFWTW